MRSSYRSIITILIVLLCAFDGLAQDTTGAGALFGFVVREDQQSPAGLSVCVAPSRCLTVGPTGSFRFPDLRPGKYTVRVESFEAAVEVRAGLDAQVEFLLPTLANQRQQVEVTASIFVPPTEIKSSAYLIPAEELKVSAAALKDVSRLLQTMPGVMFGTNDFSNDIVVRGGSPLENLYIVDNVEIPNINHFANFASAGGPVGQFNAELLSDLTFLTGGYPAPYSNRLSSVVQITQREGRRDATSGQVSVGFGGAGGIGEGPLGKKGSWIVSVRRSFLDVFTDDIGFGGVPIYWNFQGKAVYDVNDRNRLWFSSIGGRDEITIRPSADIEDQQADPFNVDVSGWRNGLGLNWQTVYGSQGVGLLGITHSRGTVRSRVTDMSIGDAEVTNQDSSEDEVTIKYDLTWNLPLLQRVQLGGSSRLFLIDYQRQSPLGIENPFSPEPGRVNALRIRESFTTSQHAAYLQVSRQLGSRVNVTAGGRWDRYSYLDRHRFSPRAGMNIRLGNGLSANASYGRYFQQPFFFFLTADPLNRGLAPMASEHFVAGVSWTPDPTFRVSVEAYEKRYRDYPVALEYPQITLASAGDGFGPNFYLFPMTAAGRGRARGIEFYASKTLAKGLYGQVNLSRQDARHAALDGVRRPGGFDSPWLFNLSGGYRWQSKWEMAIRYVYLSGRPFTPFDLERSQQQNRGVFDLSQVNAVRANSYQRFDFRVDRYFQFEGGTLDVYGGLQNAFNRENFLAEQWNFRTNSPRTMTQMGVFPIIGLEWRFR
ncbi:MAG: TonB-dependent receptor [Bryobacterales bacterium]|nr:TonB-dependent receptor [Bryobacterales bacterium]